jgi:hypothetical protein
MLFILLATSTYNKSSDHQKSPARLRNEVESSRAATAPSEEHPGSSGAARLRNRVEASRTATTPSEVHAGSGGGEDDDSGQGPTLDNHTYTQSQKTTFDIEALSSKYHESKTEIDRQINNARKRIVAIKSSLETRNIALATLILQLTDLVSETDDPADDPNRKKLLKNIKDIQRDIKNTETALSQEEDSLKKLKNNRDSLKKKFEDDKKKFLDSYSMPYSSYRPADDSYPGESQAIQRSLRTFAEEQRKLDRIHQNRDPEYLEAIGASRATAKEEKKARALGEDDDSGDHLSDKATDASSRVSSSKKIYSGLYPTEWAPSALAHKSPEIAGEAQVRSDLAAAAEAAVKNIGIPTSAQAALTSRLADDIDQPDRRTRAALPNPRNQQPRSDTPSHLQLSTLPPLSQDTGKPSETSHANQEDLDVTNLENFSRPASAVPSAVNSRATSTASSRANSPVPNDGAAPAASAKPSAQSSRIVTSLTKRMESKELTPQQQELKRQADELYVQLVRIRDEAIEAQNQITREAKEKEFREKFKQVRPELLFYNDFTSIWPNKSNLSRDSFEFRKYDSTLWRLFDPWDLTTDQSNPQ